MTKIGKSFLVLPAALAATSLVLAGCGDDGGGIPPMGTTDVSTLTPVTPTETVKPPVTVTETVTATPPTASTMNPRPAGCVDQGMNTDDWNKLTDVPSEDELQLAPADRGKHLQPMVDAPLVDVSAWTGPCFDTVMFTIDTTMNEPDHYDLPWFIGGYRDAITTEGEGALVLLDGNGDLQLTVYAKAASFVHSSGHVPPGLVNAARYYRDMDGSYGAITEVKGAGEQHGQFTFGIGVDKERPFAVHFADNGDKTAVVVRVAH